MLTIQVKQIWSIQLFKRPQMMNIYEISTYIQ